MSRPRKHFRERLCSADALRRSAPSQAAKTARKFRNATPLALRPFRQVTGLDTERKPKPNQRRLEVPSGEQAHILNNHLVLTPVLLIGRCFFGSRSLANRQVQRDRGPREPNRHRRKTHKSWACLAIATDLQGAINQVYLCRVARG